MAKSRVEQLLADMEKDAGGGGAPRETGVAVLPPRKSSPVGAGAPLESGAEGGDALVTLWAPSEESCRDV